MRGSRGRGTAIIGALPIAVEVVVLSSSLERSWGLLSLLPLDLREEPLELKVYPYGLALAEASRNLASVFSL